MFRITFTSLMIVATLALAGVNTARAQVTQADIDAYNAAVDVYNARLARYDSAADDFNNERVAYLHAVDYYNSKSADQRTQFERDRLARWYSNLEMRLDALNAELDYLVRRKAELDAWSARLDG